MTSLVTDYLRRLGPKADVPAFSVEVDDRANALVVLGSVIFLWYLAFGYLSRRFELEADLESLRVVGSSAPLISALELVIVGPFV